MNKIKKSLKYVVPIILIIVIGILIICFDNNNENSFVISAITAAGTIGALLFINCLSTTGKSK